MKPFVALLVLVLIPLTHAQNKMQVPENEKHAAHPAGGPVSFKLQVQKMADEWEAGFKSKNVDRVAAMYADDAVWINPEGTFHGLGDIKSELQKMVDRGDTVEAITTSKAVHFADIGYAEGSYSGTAPGNKNGTEEPTHGLWVVTLKSSGGKWMLATHTSVPNAALAPMSKSGKKSE